MSMTRGLVWHFFYLQLTALRAAEKIYYSDFTDTSELVLNGDTFIATTCAVDAKDSLPLQYQEDEGSRQLSSLVEMATAYDAKNRTFVEKATATFGHRYDNASFAGDPSGNCPSRLRLTPSHPSNVGSVWYEKLVPVVRFQFLQPSF